MENKNAGKKPISRSMAIGCIFFIMALCIVLGIISYFSLKSVLYQQFERYISDIITYVDSRIDDEDLKKCVDTLERSEKFDELELFMDNIKENFSIHYLYILKPLMSEDGSEAHIMSVISAENYYDRYVDTEGNLYLGWVSDDEYSVETVKKLFEVMNSDSICFFENATEWGTDYTGAFALRDEKGEAYALLAVDVDITEIRKLIGMRSAETFVVIFLLGFLFTVFFLIWTNKMRNES